MARLFEGAVFNCLRCRTSFRRSQVQIKRGQNKYCSRDCSWASHTGENNAAWKGGWHLNYRGYKKIRIEGGIYVYEHRHFMEQHLGRKLLPNEDVHHIDGNKLNNSLDNLKVLNKREHTILHDRVGEKNNKAKLTAENVRYIREAYPKGIKVTALATEFNVHESNIRYILNRNTWKHI